MSMHAVALPILTVYKILDILSFCFGISRDESLSQVCVIESTRQGVKVFVHV